MDPTPSDSEQVGDISMSSEIPDLSFHLDELATDTKETSEDFSTSSDRALASSARLRVVNARNGEQSSLNEFEEIERLIQQNTAVDSEDEDTNEILGLNEKEVQSTRQLHHDTGYHTGHYGSRRSSAHSRSTHRSAEDGNEDDTENLDSISVTYQNQDESPRSQERKSPSLSNRSQSPVWFPEQSSMNETHNTDLDVTLDPFLAPASPDAENDEKGDNNEKLVATFGTTEKFEALLEQQLWKQNEEDHSAEEDIHPKEDVTDDQKNEEQEQKQQETMEMRRPDRKVKRRSSMRTTRSPAANRVKRAQRSAVSRTSSLSSLHRDSSDELSVRSDASKGELKRRLKKESRTRKKETEVVKQLQTDYDELLTRYAEAENVIDQLRLGAKIDLFAQLPSSGYCGDFVHPSHPGADGHSPSHGQADHLPENSPRQRDDGASVGSENMDALTESSLQLPFIASTEILRAELEHKAKDLKEQIESFQALLASDALSDPEKRQALRNIEDSLRNFERDYLEAARDHDAEKRRARVYGRGSQQANAHEEFDPQSKIQAEMFRLGTMVDQLKDIVTFSSSLPQTPVSGIRSRTRNSSTSGYQRNFSDSSEDDDDVDGNFSEIMKRYGGEYPAPDDEAHTTAPSVVLSTDQESDDFHVNRSNSSMHRPDVSPLPDRFFQPAQSHHDSSPESSPKAKERTRNRTMTPNKSDTSSPGPRPRSRLPRPVGSSIVPTTNPTKKGGRDFEADSGFMGSESSRLSASTAPFTVDPKTPIIPRDGRTTELTGAEDKLRQSTAKPHQKKPMMPSSKVQQQKTHQQNTKPSMSPARPVRAVHAPMQDTRNKTSRNSATVPQPKIQDESLEESDDDISTSSTVQELLKPYRHPVSTPATAPRPGSSGSPMMSHSYRRGRDPELKSAGSVKSRASSRRSAGSSSKDSTLDLLRGEIAKLREEIRESRTKEPLNPKPKQEHETSTRDREHAEQTPSTQDGSTTRRKTGASADDGRSKYDPEQSSRDPHVRSSSLNRLLSNEENERPSSPTTRSLPHFTHSNGHWAYISPIGVQYPYAVAPTATNPPMYYSTPQPLLPTARLNTVYLTPPKVTTGRVYVPVTSPVQVAYTTDSKPKNPVVRLSARKGRTLKKASVYIVDQSDDDDDEDVPLSRSQLSPVRRRSSSLPRVRREPIVDSRLSVSLRRAEKASDDLRLKTRSMYRSLRDSLYKAEILTGTM